MKVINVSEEKADMRIDKYLIEELGFSRSKIQKLIENEKVSVNEKQIKNSHLVRVDDIITIDESIEEPMRAYT